jgi:biotin carboxyl carrier protein
MAGELNGVGAGRRPMRLAFASGGPPGAAPKVAEVRTDGTVRLGDVTLTATLSLGDGAQARLETETGSHDVLIRPLPDPRRVARGIERLEIVLDGWRFEVDVESETRARLRERATSARDDAARGGPAELRASIPGRVVSVDVAAGDSVDAGARVLILEAMKMQNELRAPRGGTVARVEVGPGQTVEVGDILVVIE